MLMHSALIVVGLIAMGWGFPAAHRLPRPLDSVAALVVLAGLCSALLGTLLVAVPGFFRG
ncbi:MAG TPA: hypothetical protein VFY07_05190 [Geomobilimonas sp.]|jgi:hypothetical protein|nr:hypothetical protein [Geomobilimonas sp.]